MRRWGLFAMGCVLHGAAWADPTVAPPPATELPAPAATTPALVDGPALAARLVEPTGHVRVVNFWATWCQPCVTELPTLTAFAKAHPDVELVLVNVDAQSSHATRVTRALTTYKLEGLHHWWVTTNDPERLLKAHVPRWASEIPFTLVIDADGVLRDHFIDAITSATLDRAVTAARLKP
jgi:thiol-disulfide isomerase/thioredoxin